MQSIKSILSASALAFATVNAHMILLTPPPYGTPDSSPLDKTGANFPCKATSNAGATVTDWKVGGKYELSFKGSAVHGGGTCQLALTTDSPATKTSKWQVIHSVIGGCPSRSSPGNLGGHGSFGGDPNSLGSDKYPFTIPDGIKAGQYTFAWTWL